MKSSPNTYHLEWLAQGARNNWTMPAAAWWKRLPVIRHVRAALMAVGMADWYQHGPGQFGIPTGYDDWALWGIWHGHERDKESTP